VRVRLTGPFKERVGLVAEEEELSLAVAERRVRDYDREMRARIQTLLNVDLDEPSNFTLALNTFAMPLKTAAAVLASLAEEIDGASREDHWRAIRDAALAAEVRAALIFHPKIGHAPLEVQCASGVVHVNGPGLVPPWDDLVTDVVRRVDGVTAVEIFAEEAPIPVRPS
jgi:hypothetical protein